MIPLRCSTQDIQARHGLGFRQRQAGIFELVSTDTMHERSERHNNMLAEDDMGMNGSQG
ncbi:hypothetical protein GGD46_003895 [Rhizobium lusitanum]|uniref:Uncharacterized protein n=1 Tax=Rhizobium lusitanum TaxID=293958 RepID=A0A7X0ISZ0_9HYPH|nr:hypothetical protein [Rhizobium lusitanum]